jgi:hypothetical protein
MKYLYIKDKSIWYKKGEGVLYHEGDELPINKKNPTPKAMEEYKRKLSEYNNQEEPKVGKAPKITVYHKTIKRDNNGKLYILKNEERLYLSDFVKKGLIDTYKSIKEHTKIYRHKKENSRMYLVSSFDRDYRYRTPKKNVDKFIAFVKEVLSGVKYRTIFTYATWRDFGYPILDNNVIITGSTHEYTDTYSRLSPTQKEKTMVFRSEIYSMTDGRCNLDMVVDLLKLWTFNPHTIVAFLEPIDINNTFYFFKNVFVLRDRKSCGITPSDSVIVNLNDGKKTWSEHKRFDSLAEVGDEVLYNMEDGTKANEKDVQEMFFPKDKFVHFFQDILELQPHWDKTKIIQIYKKTHI